MTHMRVQPKIISIMDYTFIIERRGNYFFMELPNEMGRVSNINELKLTKDNYYKLISDIDNEDIRDLLHAGWGVDYSEFFKVTQTNVINKKSLILYLKSTLKTDLSIKDLIDTKQLISSNGDETITNYDNKINYLLLRDILFNDIKPILQRYQKIERIKNRKRIQKLKMLL